MPKLSANVEEQTVTAWLKQEGESVHRGEALAEITTSKACFELESPANGILKRIFAPENSVLPVGYVAAVIGEETDGVPDVEPENRSLLDRMRGTVRKPQDVGKRVRERVRATPAARRLARRHAVSLADVQAACETTVIHEHHVRSFLESGGPAS